jgi:hypothetical protein
MLYVKTFALRFATIIERLNINCVADIAIVDDDVDFRNYLAMKRTPFGTQLKVTRVGAYRRYTWLRSKCLTLKWQSILG